MFRANTRLAVMGALCSLLCLSCGDLLGRGIEGRQLCGSALDGLIRHYRFDGDTGDASPGGQDGVLGSGYSLSYTTDRFGRSGAAAVFVDPTPPSADNLVDNFGDPSYMDTGWGLDLRVDSAYTINLWVRGYGVMAIVPQLPMHLFGVSRVAGLPYLYLSISQPVGGMRWAVGGGDMPSTHFDWIEFDETFGLLADDDWIMITAVHERGFGASRLHLYIDGVERVPDRCDSRMEAQDDLVLGESVYLGASQGLGSQATNEMFSLVGDDVRIYDRVLTQAEVLALYHEGEWQQ